MSGMTQQELLAQLRTRLPDASSASDALLSSLLPRAQFRFFGSNRRHPTVLRTQLALALLHDRDATAAGSLRAAFEDVAAGYPYPGVIGSERELLALIGEKAAAQE